jgi:hypothetical protein
MATRAEKAFCVLEYARTQPIVTVQRRFRTKFGKDPLVKNSINQWHEKLQRDGCESSLPSQESIVRCCGGYGRKLIIGLTSAAS